MFAYHAGIIENGSAADRIISDKRGAYAILLNGRSEHDSPTADTFTYKARTVEAGHFKLTAGTPDSRHPIRVLRCHTLRSLWSPKAGVRYDGLYKVRGWSVKCDSSTKTWTYDIQFQRLEQQVSMDKVLTRPLAEEVDDYMEYKRIREETRFSHNQFRRAKPLRDLDSAIPNFITAGPQTQQIQDVPIIIGKSLSNRPIPKSCLRIEMPAPPNLEYTADLVSIPATKSGEPVTTRPYPKTPRSPLRTVVGLTTTALTPKSRQADDYYRQTADNN